MSVSILGQRQSGQQVRQNNITAVTAIGNVLRSSLGPRGLDKMIVDDVGEVVITNDGATILKQLEIQHPAAKMLVELADVLDREAGDGTTSVVLVAIELLRRGNSLIEMSVHPTGVISGYRLACKEATNYVERELSFRVSKSDTATLMAVASTTLSSKYVGSDSKHFEMLCVDAIRSVEQITESGDLKYPVAAINIVKNHGGSMKDSYLADGYVFPGSRVCQSMPAEVHGAKIALIDFPLKQHRMQLGITVDVIDPEELENIRMAEKDIVRRRVAEILSSGTNVIMSSQGIDDLAMKYFSDANAMAIRRVPKKMLNRIAKLTKATICRTMATMEGDEKFPSVLLGRCDLVADQQIGDRDHIIMKGVPGSKSATIVLRGANEFILDEVERSVHDALCAVSRALEFGQCCPGGGAVEAALSVYLGDFARTLGPREQLAVAEFADALTIIPKCLAVNAALDSTELIAKLKYVHGKGQSGTTDDAKENKWFGLDLNNGTVFNSVKNGVIEPLAAKLKAIRFATEAAVMILRVDDFIKLEPPAEKKPQEYDN